MKQHDNDTRRHNGRPELPYIDNRIMVNLKE